MKKEIQISLKNLIETIGVSVLIFNNSLTLECFNESAKKLIPDLKEKSAAEAIFNSKRISSQILECLKTDKIRNFRNGQLGKKATSGIY